MTTVIEALAAVAKAVGPIEKGDTNDEQGFKFRGIERILAAAAPALDEHGVIFVPKVKGRIMETYERGQNRNTWRLVTLSVVYRVYGPEGDSIKVGPVPGEGYDPGDKAASKAMTMAYKAALLQVLHIAGSMHDDSDYESHGVDEYGNRTAGTRGGPAKRTAKKAPAKKQPAKKQTAPPRKAAAKTPEQIVAPLIDLYGAGHAAAVAALIETMNAVEPESDRLLVKSSFVRNFGSPAELAPDRLDAAAGFLGDVPAILEAERRPEPSGSAPDGPVADDAPEAAAVDPGASGAVSAQTSDAPAASEPPAPLDADNPDMAFCRICGEPSDTDINGALTGFCTSHGPF